MKEGGQLMMKHYTEPSLELLLLTMDDILTVSDPYLDDPDWDNLAQL